MTVLKDVFNFITKAHNMERPPAVGTGITTLGGFGASGSNKGQEMTTYSTVSWVFAAVSRIAEAVSSSEWKLYRGPGTANEVTTHPALTLWNSVNPFDTRQEFLETSQQTYELAGESWWVLVRNGRGVPVEMWAVRPDRMTPIKDRNDYIVGYLYQIGSEKIFYDPLDVIFIRHPNPLDPYRGLGPIASLILDLGSEVEAANFNRAFFRNDATPGGIIEVDRTMSNSDFDKMVERWRTMHQGTNNAGRIGFLERAKWVERKFSQRDMQYVQLRQQTRDLVLAAYGVPLPMLGVMEAPSRANAQAAEFIFARWTVRPRLARIRLSLNERLLKLFPDRGLHFEFEDPTPNNRELDLEESTESYKAGIATLNEARTRIGLDPLPNGDVVLTPGAPMALGAKPDQLILVPISQGASKVSALKAPDPLEIAEQAMLLAWERRLATEADALVAYLEDILGEKSFRPRTKIELSDVQGYDWDWWTKYAPEVIEELTAAFRASMINEFPRIGPLLADDLAAEYAKNRGARLLRVDGDLNIVNATRARVNILVSQTIERGDSLQTLQKALREDLAFGPSKAETIARTETATAQGEGARQAALRQDFNQKRWITQGDDLVDESGTGTPCLDNEAQGWIKIGDPFASGHDTLPAHPRCRCNVRYRLKPLEDVTTATVDGGTNKCPDCQGTLILNNQGAGHFCRRCRTVVLPP